MNLADLRAIRNDLRSLGRLAAATAVDHAIIAWIRRDPRLTEHWLELAHQYNHEGSEG